MYKIYIGRYILIRDHVEAVIEIYRYVLTYLHFFQISTWAQLFSYKYRTYVIL